MTRSTLDTIARFNRGATTVCNGYCCGSQSRAPEKLPGTRTLRKIVARTDTYVTVRDTTPPVITSVTPSQTTLWPPNYQLVAITLRAAATDAVGVTSLKIISATSNEPDNGLGDGDTANDIAITGNLTLTDPFPFFRPPTATPIQNSTFFAVSWLCSFRKPSFFARAPPSLWPGQRETVGMSTPDSMHVLANK